VILPTGEVNPAVEAHRKNAHEQLYLLSVYTELNCTQNSKAVDIVAEMARDVEATEAVESGEQADNTGSAQSTQSEPE
jgi:hypothetical protein